MSASALADVAGADGDEMIEEADRVRLGGQRDVPFQRGAVDLAFPPFGVAVQDALAGDGTDQDGERRERTPPVEPGLGGGNDLHDALQGSARKPAAGPGIPLGVTRKGIRFQMFVRPRDAMRKKPKIRVVTS